MEHYDYYILGTDFAQAANQSFLSWVTDSANIMILAQLFAALITALATIALWRVTRVLAVETKTLAKMTAQPFVTCSLQSSVADSFMLDLIIENNGNAVAFDIKIIIDPALPAYDGARDPNDKKTIDISMLPPGIKLPKNGVQSKHVLAEKFNAFIEWKTRPGAVEKESVSYAFSADDGFKSGWGVKGMHQLVQEVEKIRHKI